ncbi:MAG: 23S rRNA (guanosine(2251)-2'-O)-methyltransferase RlmB [Firmicutes bacterium]|nr:23S rRNA (guanosine(2251)-2'-O)-methyltransferase RlmB [Bacillota bacterium]
MSGRRAVMEALKSGRPINKILVQESASGGGLGELLALAREQSAVVQQVPKAKLDEVAKNKSHQGVLAYVAAKPYVDLDDLIAIAKRSYPGLIVVLDGLEDPHNLGSVLRSVDGAGAAGVVIPKRRAVPLTGTVSKASAGALEHVEVARVSNMSQALDDLKKAGFWVMGAAGEANTLYTDADLTGNIALVIGNEGTGLGKLVRERCDALIKLPMYGQVNSLNAGVATGILLYEVLRQRAAKG